MSSDTKVPVIGLVGGIGSGKSALAEWLARRRRVAVLDGDRMGHQLLQRTAVKEQLREEFGEAVLDQQGNIDRAALSRMVFGTSPEQQEARNKLEIILHPKIRERMMAAIAEWRANGEVEAILLDAAVLLEAGWRNLCDCVVFVEAPEEQRLRRLKQRRGWTPKELQMRESSQLALDRKRRLADEIIVNSGPLEEAGRELERILERILKSRSETFRKPSNDP